MKVSFDPRIVIGGVNALLNTALTEAGKKDWKALGLDLLKIAVSTAITAARVEHKGQVIVQPDYFGPNERINHEGQEGEYRGG